MGLEAVRRVGYSIGINSEQKNRISLIIRLSINAAVILGIAYLVPQFSVSSFWSALLFALVLGVINAFIRPLVKLLSLPANIATLGLFTFVINASLFWLASSFVAGVEIGSFAAAFWAALFLSVASGLLSFFIKK